MRLPKGFRKLFRLGHLLSDAEREVDDELRHHFDEAVRRGISKGQTAKEAAREARKRFGDERAYREALRRIDEDRFNARDRNDRVDTVVRTVTHTARRLRRAPGFTVAVTLILALGIGANAVMFGVVDRLLLSPPQHIVDADDVRHLNIRRVIFNGDVNIGSSLTWPDYRDFTTLSSFESVAAFTRPRTQTVGRGDGAAPAVTAGASASFFPLLGVTPVLGRFYDTDEDEVDSPPTAVLSEEYWKRAYGGDRSVLGKPIDIGQQVYTIVGVTPAGFSGATLAPVDVWLPIVPHQSAENGDEWLDNRGWYWVRAVGRLRGGTSVEAAEAEATAAHRGGRSELIDAGWYDENAEVLASSLIPARGPQPSEEVQVARWLSGVSLIVLLIACFNVANLLLARAVNDRREIAIRLALGVGRRRLAGELLAESLGLALLGSMAAVLIASLFGGTIHRVLLPEVAFSPQQIGFQLVGFTLFATVTAGVLTGALPALHAVRTGLGDTLRSGGRSVSGSHIRTRRALLIGQAALSVVLLVGAALFVQSLRQAQRLDLGFDADRLVIATLEWNETFPAEQRKATYEEVGERVRRLPGVQAAGMTYTVPFRSSISLGQPRVPGLDSVPLHHSGGPYVNKVGPETLRAMGLRIVAGRGIEPSDDSPEAPPVAVVSESMADAYWPAGDALGSCMFFGDDPAPACTEVIGVVENHRRQELIEEDPHFLYYVNQGHPDFQGPPQALMVGTSGNSDTVVESIRDEARSTSSSIRFVTVNSMTDFVAPEMRSWRMGATVFTIFGLLALIVAGWGLYSVLAFDVALRRSELGIRSALGAGTQRIVQLVLKQAVSTVLVGTALGLVIAAWGATLVQPLLYEVSARDPRTYVTVALALLVVSGVAGSFPAWRATRVDPRTALRTD